MPRCSSAFSAREIRTSERPERAGLEDWYRRAGRLVPWFAWAAAASFAGAAYLVFAAAPAGVAHGEHHRIAFIHGPATWISVLLYVATACSAAFRLLTKQQLPSMLASALAPTTTCRGRSA